MHSAFTALPIALALCACAPMPAPTADAVRVDVSVAYRERIMLSPEHVLTVRVEDVSRADAPAVVVAETSRRTEGRAPPFEVALDVPADRIDARHTYAVRAEIREPGGALRFTTDRRHAVLTRDAPNRADIMLVAVR